MNALVRFNLGLWRLSIGVKLWLLVLMIANLLVPLVYLQHIEARIVLVVFFASFVLQVVLTGMFGFTRILGLGHILWVSLVIFLVGRAGFYPVTDPYGLWMRSVIVLNSISLVFDMMDVIRYTKGEREEMVSVE